MTDDAVEVMRPYRHNVQPVEIVDSRDRDALRSRVAEHRPFLAKGLVDSWPVVQEVRKASDPSGRVRVFKSLLGDSDIRFTYTPAAQRGDIGIGPDMQSNFQMDDGLEPGNVFLDRLSRLLRDPTGECLYAAALPVSHLPGLEAALESLDDICDSKPRQRNLWIGSGDHVVDLHFDYMRNLLSMITGVKRVTILPPEALPYIYPAPLHRPVAGVTRSLVKLLETDFEKYPRFREALELAQVAVVEPGDTLHIPALWWHHVESYGFNAMINAWYNDVDSSSMARFEDAHRLFRKSIIPFSRLDDAEAKSAGRYMDSAVFTSRPDSRTASPRPPWLLRRRLSKIRDSLGPLDPYWRDYLKLQYEYYCIRRYGDPYPTVPGMLHEVAAAMRMNVARGIRRRLSRLLGTPSVSDG